MPTLMIHSRLYSDIHAFFSSIENWKLKIGNVGSTVAHTGAPLAQSGYSLAQIGAFWAQIGTQKYPQNRISSPKSKFLYQNFAIPTFFHQKQQHDDTNCMTKKGDFKHVCLEKQE